MSSKALSIEQWNRIEPPSFGITIGNFDGVHLGHERLLSDFVRECQVRKIRPIAFTFVPHPELYFSPEKDHLISSYEYRRKRLFELGVEIVVECDFKQVRSMTGDEFAKQYLQGKPNLKLVWIGHDFTFGKNKIEPNSSMFTRAEVIKNSPVIKNSKIISSSLIRDLIRRGQVSEVPSFLGAPFEVYGQVVHGKKLGRTIGFPTANITPEYKVVVPKLGVYSVEVLVDGLWRKGIINVGKNPSVEKASTVKWEAHVMDYSGDLYGKELRVAFKKFIRPEMKFSSAKELAAQIAKDLTSIDAQGAK